MLDVVCFGEILWDIFETGRAGASRSPRVPARARRRAGERRDGARAPRRAGGGGRRRRARPLRRGAGGAPARPTASTSRFVVRLPNRTGLDLRRARRARRARVPLLPARVRRLVRPRRARHARHGARPLGARRDEHPDDAEPARGGHAAVPRGRRRAPGRTSASISTCARTCGRTAGRMRAAIAELAARAALVKASDADLARRLGGARDSLARAARARRRRGSSRAAPASRAPSARTGAVDAPGPARALRRRHRGRRRVHRRRPGDAASGAAPSRARPRGATRPCGRTALRAGHIMGKKAVSRAGAVAGLVGLGRASQSVRSEGEPS